MKLSKTIASIKGLGPRFFLLFSAGTLSDIGGFSTHAAIMLHVYNITGGNTAFMGLAALASLIPMVISAPIGGVWAEKYNRKWVMILNDLFRFPLVLVFLLVSENVWLVLGLQSLISASTAAFMPSRQAIIPELIREDQVHLGNSINGGVVSVIHALGPLLGATLYARTGTLKWIVLLDAFTYAGSALLLFGLSYAPLEKIKEAASTLLNDISAGLAYVYKEKDFLHIFILLLSVDSAIGILLPLMRPFIGDVLHGNDENYGHLIMIFGVGGILGPVVGYWAGRRFGLGLTLSTSFLLEGFLLIAFSRTTHFYTSGAVLFFWGINVFVLIPCYMSYIHSYAKPEFMGRTFSLFDLTSYGAQILGAGVVVVIGNFLPVQNLLTFAGIFYLIIVAVTFRRPGARLLRSRRGKTGAAAHAEEAPAAVGSTSLAPEEGA